MVGVNSRGRIPVRNPWIFVLCLFLAGASLASVAVAQLPTATILGVVKDSSGAVVPDANLTARNVETGQTRTTVSSADGSYRFSALPVGSYEVRVEHPGFQSEVRSGLTLTVSEEAVVNITLQVGAVEQTVTVTAEAPLVNTTSGSLGGLVSEQKMADLPLNGHNYIDLTLLQTGVAEMKTVNRSLTGNAGTYFVSNGATVRSNMYLLDGAILTNILNATSASMSGSTLGVEGIREYRVITNAFSAEYGMVMGSQMIVVSKNGTNNFHGSLFEYLRNSALDARNFFDYQSAASQRRLPEFIRNNFGAAFGGPIKKDKTFFFGVYEGVRERLGLSIIDTVPPASARVDGGLVPTINPVVKPILALFPNPNLPNNQITFPFTQPATDNYGQMRVDQNFSTEDSLFVRYTIQDTQKTQTEGYPLFSTPLTSRTQFSTLSENHVFSPTVLNTLRFSLSRTIQASANGAQNPGGPGISYVPGFPLGPTSIGGITGPYSLGSNLSAPTLRKQNIFSYSDDIFYTRGRHSLKFGTLINHYQQLTGNGSYSSGQATFPSLTAFLLGQPSVFQATVPGSLPSRTFHFNTLGFYAQDDLRVRSNLTFNLGLRYEFSTVAQEQHGQWAHLNNLQTDAQMIVNPAVGVNPSLRNFSPRFGFAWDVKGDGKTAVRGGFGLLYDIGQVSGSLAFQTLTAQPPFTVNYLLSNPAGFTVPVVPAPAPSTLALRLIDYNMQQPHMLQYNLTVERQLPFEIALTLAYAGSRGLNLYQSYEGDPIAPQILPDGRKFWSSVLPRVNPNWGTINFFSSGADSYYNSLQFGLVKRLSRGLQFQSSYTWSKLIDTIASSTNSENSFAQSSFYTDPFHMALDRGLSPFDVTHIWKFNTIYNLPQFKSSRGMVGKALNGWWLSGILSLQSGNPFTVALNSNRSRSGIGGGAAGVDRPDLAPGRTIANIVSGTSAGCLGVPAGTPLGTPNHYYDPCAFTIPAAGFLGTAGRNILRGPGFANLDFSLVKDTALGFLGEAGKLEFRAEVFNILNRANFELPSRNVYAATADLQAPLPTAGLITSTVGSSRQIQLALKILF